MPDELTTLTPEKKWIAKFLDVLSETGNVSKAAKAARISRMTAYNERAKDSAFASAWDVAKERGIDALEDAALERAFDGSDTLLIFLLKAARPHYRDKQPPGLTLTKEQLSEMSDSDLDDLAAKLTRLS